MPQIQHYHDFIFEDHWPDFVNDYIRRNEFQGLNFLGMPFIHKNSKIYVPRKFVRVQILLARSLYYNYACLPSSFVCLYDFTYVRM